MTEELQKAFCFMVPNIDGLEEMIPLAKERQTEISSCRELGMPYFLIPADLFDLSKSDLALKTEKIASLSGRTFSVKKPVESLEGYRVLSRLWPKYVSRALDVITGAGGVNELSHEDFRQAFDWPKYVDPSFLNRKLGIVTASQLGSLVSQYAIDGKVFVKTKVKMLSEKPVIATLEELANVLETGLPSKRLDINKQVCKEVEPTTEIIISEPIPILRDEKGRPYEHRVWVVNNSVSGICSYEHQLPSDVKQFAYDFVEAHKGRLPKHSVFDIAQTQDRGNVLVEVNDFMCSGNHDIELFKKVIADYKR